MLSSIHLQLTDLKDLGAVTGDLATDLTASTDTIATDSNTPVAGFADLLKQPILVADPTVLLETGQDLPDGGNVLPSAIGESLPVYQPIGEQSVVGDQLRPGALQLGLPSVGMAAPSDALTQSEPTLTTLRQSSTGLLPVSTQQGQRDVLQAGPVADRLPVENVAAVRRIVESGHEMRPIINRDRIENRIRPTTSLDADAIQATRVPESSSTAESLARLTERMQRSTAHQPAGNVIRPTTQFDPDALQRVIPAVSESTRDPLAGMIERVQGQVSIQPVNTTPSSATTPLTVGLAPTVTTGSATPLASPAPASPPLPNPINIPLQDAAWGDALGERVLFMTGQKIHSAAIRLNPAELGPITINVVVDDGAADITFIAQHAVAREAIELAMPRLRELLSDNGLSLGNASVAEQGVEKEGKGNEAKSVRDTDELAADASAEEETLQANSVRVPQGLVDTFA